MNFSRPASRTAPPQRPRQNHPYKEAGGNRWPHRVSLRAVLRVVVGGDGGLQDVDGFLVRLADGGLQLAELGGHLVVADLLAGGYHDGLVVGGKRSPRP